MTPALHRPMTDDIAYAPEPDRELLHLTLYAVRDAAEVDVGLIFSYHKLHFVNLPRPRSAGISYRIVTKTVTSLVVVLAVGCLGLGAYKGARMWAEAKAREARRERRDAEARRNSGYEEFPRPPK